MRLLGVVDERADSGHELRHLVARVKTAPRSQALPSEVVVCQYEHSIVYRALRARHFVWIDVRSERSRERACFSAVAEENLWVAIADKFLKAVAAFAPLL